MDNRTCSKCGETKPVADFPRDASQPSGLGSHCKRCKHRSSREWKKRNPEKVLAQVARWNARNPNKRREIAAKWAAENKDRAKATTEKRRIEQPDWFHETHLKHKYGVPRGTYARLLAAQEGRCAICGTTEPGRKLKRFHLDHCHDTGEIRGLLCAGCNVGIAHLQHSEEILISALRYLGY
jgi:Recombination endonuclease VII